MSSPDTSTGKGAGAAANAGPEGVDAEFSNPPIAAKRKGLRSRFYRALSWMTHAGGNTADTVTGVAAEASDYAPPVVANLRNLVVNFASAVCAAFTGRDPRKSDEEK